MSNNGWYSFDGNQVDSYTDFTNGTYTDLTEIRTGTPIKKKRVRNAEKKAARSAGKRAAKAEKMAAKAAKKAVKGKKKGTAGKVIFGVAAAAVAVVAGTFLVKEGVVQACTENIIDEYFSGADSKETAVSKGKKPVEEAFEITEECTSYDKSSPAYSIAEDIMADLWRDNDIDTAYEIFNWVHSNISYQTLTSYESFEEAAFDGFTKRNGDCYVYFACSKMLLDIAGIPNLMVERYPVETNSHYWNLVQIDGLWYHCDATVFRDHPGMYFLLTDDEIDDGHHSFDHSLYPERAASCYEGDDYWDDSYDVYYEDSYYDSYVEDSYYDPYNDCYEDSYYWDDSYAVYDEPYGGYGPNSPYVDYEDYEYSYAPYEGEFMDSFEDAYVVNYDN